MKFLIIKAEQSDTTTSWTHQPSHCNSISMFEVRNSSEKGHFHIKKWTFSTKIEHQRALQLRKQTCLTSKKGQKGQIGYQAVNSRSPRGQKEHRVDNFRTHTTEVKIINKLDQNNNYNNNKQRYCHFNTSHIQHVISYIPPLRPARPNPHIMTQILESAVLQQLKTKTRSSL